MQTADDAAWAAGRRVLVGVLVGSAAAVGSAWVLDTQHRQSQPIAWESNIDSIVGWPRARTARYVRQLNARPRE